MENLNNSNFDIIYKIDDPYFNLSVDKALIMNNRDSFDYRPNCDLDSNVPVNNNIIANNIIGLPIKETMSINEKKDERNPIKDDKTNYTNYSIDKKKKINKKGQISLLGRKKRAESQDGEHNKFSDDNLRKKVKHLVLDTAFNFINNKINEIYKGNIGHGIFIKKLLLLNQKQKSESSIQYNKDFLQKTLGEIFSEKISSRYTKHNPYHNYFLIKALTSDKNENNNYFKKLFNITFIDCLEHFIGNKKVEELEGLDTFENIKTKYEDDADYLKSLKFCIMNYKKIINNKRTRIRKQN